MYMSTYSFPESIAHFSYFYTKFKKKKTPFLKNNCAQEKKKSPNYCDLVIISFALNKF